LTIAAAALCLAAAAAGATTRTTTVVRGGTLHFRMKGGWLTICTAIVTYAGGQPQFDPSKRADNGWVSWAIPVARSRPLGRGTWIVRCGLKTRASGRFVVVNPRSAG
jgi:hypothetical protein